MSDSDRIFLETTRRLAPRRLAQEDVRIALQLAQVEPGKPVADLGCGFGRHLRELLQYGHRATGIDRSSLLLAEASTEAPGAALVRADLRSLPLHQGSLSAELHIRYYPPDALAALAYVAGLRFVRLHEPLTETTPQLIALLEK